MSSLRARSPGVPGVTVQPPRAPRPGELALKHEQSVTYLNVNEQNRCDSSVRKIPDCKTVSFFSQNRFCLSLSRARRASLTRPSLPSLALRFHPEFAKNTDCFCSLEKVNQSINKIKYLFILNFANIGRVTATALDVNYSKHPLIRTYIF